MASHNDLYLRGALQMNPTSTTPGPTVALDTLLRMHSMQEMPFHYEFIDRPRAGTSAIVWHDPARPSWPSDGIRYLSETQPLAAGGHVGEKFSTTTLPLPNNVAGVAELETGVISHGIFPPGNPAIPVAKDSPDLLLARFRIRWRIVTPGLGNLALWLVYWGRDERMQQRAPAGWEREPIRQYPLPMLPPEVPMQFPLRNGIVIHPQQLQLRPAQGSFGAAGSPAPAQPAATMQGSPPPSGHMSATMMGSRDMQAKARRPTSANMPPMPQPGQQQAYPFNATAAARQGSVPAGGMPPQPGAHNPSPQHSVQASRQGTPKQSNATTAGRKGQSKASISQASQAQAQAQAAAMAVAQMQAAQQQAVQAAHMRNASAAALGSQAMFPQPFNDPFDYLSDRSWSGLRYEHNHALIAPIFEPSNTTELLETWELPSPPDLEKLNAEIAALQKEVDALKMKVKQPMKASPSKQSTTSGEGPSSLALNRKTSLACSLSRDRDDTSRAAPQASNFEALLAPLPRLMPIAEMQDKAMQAHNARRKEIEEVLNAQKAAKMEEERIERERVEAEEARKREEEQRIEREAQERRRLEREEEVKAMQKSANGAKQEPESPTKPSAGSSQMPSQSQSQSGSQSTSRPFQDLASQTSASQPTQPSQTTSHHGNSSGFFDDSYNLLMKNDFGSYGGGAESGADTQYGLSDMDMNMMMMGSGNEDGMMMDESLFELEYLNQMGDDGME